MSLYVQELTYTSSLSDACTITLTRVDAPRGHISGTLTATLGRDGGAGGTPQTLTGEMTFTVHRERDTKHPEFVPPLSAEF